MRVAEPRILAAGGLSRISDTSPGDIFLAGYPRSGNTWMQNLLAATVYGCHPAYGSDGLAERLIPDVHQVKYYARVSPVMFFKTHDLPGPQHKRVIFLVRDGRDAMVSYVHFLTETTGRRLDMFELITGTDLWPSKWHEHAEAWLDNPWNADLLTIRYEDLKADAPGQLRRVCTFAELDRPDEFLYGMCDAASFPLMQKREAKQRGLTDDAPRDVRLTRRGEIGSYRDEMSPHALQEFMRQSEEMLRHFGYAAGERVA
jgi:hypothetical protein